MRVGIEGRIAKERLKLIVDRRNKIAHEADADPSYPHARWPIDEEIVSQSVDYLVSICDFIFEFVCVDRVH